MKAAIAFVLVLLVGFGASGCKKTADIGETVQGPKHVGANGPSLGPSDNAKRVPDQP